MEYEIFKLSRGSLYKIGIIEQIFPKDEQLVCSDRATLVICLECLRFEFVEEAKKLSLRGFDNSGTVLPYCVFRIVTAANRIALVLVDIMDT